MMTFELYRLADGTEIRVDATASKAEPVIGYEVNVPADKPRKIVNAYRVAKTYEDSEWFQMLKRGER